MRRGREARLDRLATPLRHAEMAEIRRRTRLRAHATFGGAIRHALECHGIDPGVATRLREVDTAEAALAAIPDTSELKQADDEYRAGARSGGSGASEKFAAEMRRLAQSYKEDGKIDLAIAPPTELFAWCVARGYIELQLSGDNLLLICCNEIHNVTVRR